MGWIATGAWIFAALVTLVVLGFCGYEIWWKAQRLQRNLATVRADAERLDGLRARVVELRTQVSASAPGAGRASTSDRR